MSLLKEKTSLNECVEIRVSRRPGNVFDIYLHNEILEPHYYVDLLTTLRNCMDHDDVRIYINSYGGNVATTFQIINAMKQCPAPVTTIIESEAHSAASLIFLAGQNYVIQPGAAMLCHYYSGGEWGKGHELKSAIDFKDKHFKLQFKYLYEHFLSTEELEQLFSGTDFWLNAVEIKKRLQNKVEIINKVKETKEHSKKKHRKTHKKIEDIQEN